MSWRRASTRNSRRGTPAMSDSFLLACLIREGDCTEWPESPDGCTRAPRPTLKPKEASREPSALDLLRLASSRNSSFNSGSFSLGSPGTPSRRSPKVYSGAAVLGAASSVMGAASGVLGAAASAGSPQPHPPRRIISYLNNHPSPVLPPPLTDAQAASEGLVPSAFSRRAPISFPGAQGGGLHSAFNGGRAMNLLASTIPPTPGPPPSQL